MSSQTTTTTAFGEMRVEYREDGQQAIRAICKRCGEASEQLVAGDVNPFEAVRLPCAVQCWAPRPAELAAGAAPAVRLPFRNRLRLAWRQLCR